MTTVEQDTTKYDRLPKWAQVEIANLRGSLVSARAELAVGPEDSDTFADPYAAFDGGKPRPLGRRPLIHFGPLEGPDRRNGFEVMLQADGGLQVRAEYQIAVQPQASNVVVVRVVS